MCILNVHNLTRAIIIPIILAFNHDNTTGDEDCGIPRHDMKLHPNFHVRWCSISELVTRIQPEDKRSLTILMQNDTYSNPIHRKLKVGFESYLDLNFLLNPNHLTLPKFHI